MTCHSQNDRLNTFLEKQTGHFESLCQLTPDIVDKDSIDVAVNTITNYIISSADIKSGKRRFTWLKAIVVPIPKPGKDKQDPNNYRPIALTSCLSKLLERMFSARLMHVLERSKWFVSSQSGFRRRRGIIDNLLKLETAIREAFLRKKHLASIFFDIEKAYNRTWRYGILKDLSDIGLKGNLPLFIKNFLQTRIFQIRIGNILSDNFNQQKGVPQGSVLSVLFIIKINGIVSKLPAYVNSTLL
ncbi:putative RNA-directed DNA polymerase from transposon X-element [Araneus ventricosus]|uniref:Putative RNA-directed DNA polymerase from transposon X-element n=1 Tax=Araneus ventricosus TaxID=182803 RepID=A0A4Y2G4S1_ARAVE|nr:putative RNA-directed DNA polymerase from transposon X-element [Araneus ventricosus]